MSRIHLILTGLVLVSALTWTLMRDLHLINLMPGDIRNRVVGARLQKDNRSPYFYKWKMEDGIRYYDPANFNSYSVSPSTASPFFHILLYPLADLEQHTINKIWLALQYLLLTISVFLCFRLARSGLQKIAVLLAGAGILFTEGWISMVVLGQLYLIPPFLAILFVYFLKSKKYPIVSGLTFIVAILIRPTFLFFFFPFVFLFRKFSKKYKVVFFTPSVFCFIWIFSSGTQRSLWVDYMGNIREQVKVHYTGNPTLQINDPDPQFPTWEGMDNKEIAKEAKKGWFVNQSQHINVSFLLFDVFHTKIPLQLLTGLFFLTAAAGFIFFMYVHNPDRTVYNFALLGYVLYMLCDFFSPIDRYQYYAVQWVFPLLLSAVIFRSQFRKIYFLIVISLLLNIVNVSFIKMEHTIGEYLWLACFFYLAVFYQQQKQSEA